MLKRLSPRAEWILINVLCFGPLVALSVRGMLARQTIVTFDDRGIWTIVAIDVICGTLAALILRARGWKLADLGMRITMPLTIAGVVLMIVANVAIAGLYQAFVAITGVDPADGTEVVTHVSKLALVALILIDPLFEETFEVAYNIRATEKNGAAFAITFSTAVRFICHLWQGPIVALTILPLGIILAAVYWRWRRVWPLVIARALSTYFGLTSM
ncbi:MAG: CPBP family intramembrane glutamic endopeptidase [Thermoanaerobaculia bacterium]